MILARMLAAGPAVAAPGRERIDFLRSGTTTFVTARAAADAGDARRAAMLYASLAAADPGDIVAARKALSQAILAGDMPLAIRLARSQPRNGLGVDGALLLIGDALLSGRIDKEAGSEFPQQLSFIAPFVGAWSLHERGRWREAVKLLDQIGTDAPLGAMVPEHKALILLAAGQVEGARALIPAALAASRGRATRVRIALAFGLAATGQRNEGLALLAGRQAILARAAARLRVEPRPRPVIGNAAQGYSELLTALAMSIEDDERSEVMPLALAQVARYVDPRNDPAALLVGLLLDRRGRGDDGLAVLRATPDSSPFLNEARDLEVRILLGADRKEEALARARAFVQGDDDQAADWMRLGDVLDALDRHVDASIAYGEAAAAVRTGRPGPEPWSIHLLRGAALEQAGWWSQAESALELAHQLSPANPTVLNYLGYARLKRGEKLDEAEAMIAEASRRAPDDASITDSLGWAQYKRGKLPEAIATLQRAATGDPAQAEIHEHLGDALYAAGRKYEARFAWNAALVTAEDDVRKRVEAKIASGLSKANAAP